MRFEDPAEIIELTMSIADEDDATFRETELHHRRRALLQIGPRPQQQVHHHPARDGRRARDLAVATAAAAAAARDDCVFDVTKQLCDPLRSGPAVEARPRVAGGQGLVSVLQPSRELLIAQRAGRRVRRSSRPGRPSLDAPADGAGRRSGRTTGSGRRGGPWPGRGCGRAGATGDRRILGVRMETFQVAEHPVPFAAGLECLCLTNHLRCRPRVNMLSGCISLHPGIRVAHVLHLSRAHEKAAAGCACEVLDPLHTAVVPAASRGELNANPFAVCKARWPDKADCA